MNDLKINVLSDENIDECRELCNELMKFQKSKAIIAKEAFDAMNFNTRMKKSYENAEEKQAILVKDGETPIAYIFSTIDLIENNEISLPDWAPKLNNAKEIKGFYPDWIDFPKKIGCLSNLYIKENYRSFGLGSRLFNLSMDFFHSFKYLDLVFTFVSSGNDDAYNFYIKHGFTYSHEVFAGFIKALYKKL